MLALKLLAGVLAGATITLLLWPDDEKSGAPRSFMSDRFDAAFAPYSRESTVYRSAPQQSQHATRARDAKSLDALPEQAIPSNFPRRVQTVKLTPPANSPTAAAPASPTAANPLAGKPLRYLIGAQASGPGRDADVTVVAYGAEPVKRGISIAYGNLFDEHNTGRYGPYLRTSDTAAQYNEGQIDPRGPGWEKNLREQFERRRKQGFAYIELDNPDAYSVKDVIGAIELAASYGLKVIAKNPLLLRRRRRLLRRASQRLWRHRGARRRQCPRHGGAAPQGRQADLPVWFVAFGRGRGWAGSVAKAAKHYRNMGVTYSSAGEYGNAIDILPPA